MLYRPLDSANDEIWLLAIQPNIDTEAHLQCQLESTSLRDRPVFESLSYAWGSAVADVPLGVGNHELLITDNLAHALRAVRGVHHPMSLWVDAICINQRDLQERNHQVQLMRKIYTSATKVNVWLGQDFIGANVACLLLMELAKGTPLRELLAVNDPSSAPNRVEYLAEMFRYPWWTRLWVIQKVLLANEAMVHCGPHRLPFRTIVEAFEHLWNEAIIAGRWLRRLCGAERIEILIRKLEATIRRLHTIRSFVFCDSLDGKRHFRDSPETLPFLLHTCSWSEVTDSRDKLYGVLGLLPTTILQPDYTLSVGRIFTQCTVTMMQKMDSLALLSQAGISVPRFCEIPSWVPDWRNSIVLTAPFLVFREYYDAGKGSPLDISLSEDRVLALSGMIIDEINNVGPVYDHQDCIRSANLPAILRSTVTDWKHMSVKAESEKQMRREQQVQNHEQMRVQQQQLLQSQLRLQRRMQTQRLAGDMMKQKTIETVNSISDTSTHAPAPETAVTPIMRVDSGVRAVPQPQSQRAPVYVDADYDLQVRSKRRRYASAGDHTTPP